MSTIKLKAPSGGSVSLVAEDTASDVVFTIPATPGSIVTTAALAAPTGSSLVGYMPAGVGAGARTVENKLRESVSVLNFCANGVSGALVDPTGVIDSTAGVQAFFNYAQANKCDAYCVGNFLVSSPIVSLGGSESTFFLNAKLTASVAMDFVIKFKDHSGCYFSGDLAVYGAGGVSYASRLCKDGVVFEGCRGSTFERLHAERFLRYGVNVSSVGNNTLLDIGNVRAHFCGSSISTDYKLTLGYTGKINSGSGSSFSQRSVITLGAVPANLAVNMLCSVDSEPCIVTAIAGSNITVYPWIKSTSATGSVDFYIGAAVKIEGDDAASVNFNSIDSTYSAVGLHSASLYGFNGSRLLTQFNGVGLVVGNNTTSGYFGNTLSSFYAEGNSFDLIKTTVGTSGITINGVYIYTPGKCFQLGPRMAATYEYDGLYNTLTSTQIANNGNEIRKLQAVNGLGGYTTGYTVTADNSVIPIKGGNSISVALALDAGNEKNFGHNHVTFIVYGRRAVSCVDSITFTPANPLHTVMGVASYAITGVTTVMMVTAWFNYEASNWVISKQELNTRLSGSATFDPASVATGLGVTTTVTVTGAAVGDYAIASFSRDLLGVSVTAYVSAVDTVSVRFQNNTAGTIDLASGTLRVLVTKM